jgi:hypothetical protein
VHSTDGCTVEAVAEPAGWLKSTGLLNAWVTELDGQIVGRIAVSEPQPGDDAARLWLDQSDDKVKEVVVLGRRFVKRLARGRSIGEQLPRRMH